MEKVVVELEVKSNKGIKEVKNLKKELSNTKDEAKKTNESLNTVTGGAIGKFKGLKSSIGGVVKGFKSLKFAIIASGIGALLLAVVAVGKAFTSSEEGQNKFAKIMGVIGSVTGNLIDLLSDLGEKIISVFENPKQAIIDLKNLIVENITNRFNAIIDTLGFLGSAFKKVFSGDFSGAMDDAKKAGSSYIDVLTGVEGTIDKVTGAVKRMTDEITKDAKVAANIADQRAKADKLERSLIVERAEANRKRAELLDKAVQKEKFSAKERIEFLKEAGRIEDEITAKEIIAARIRFETKVAENALSKSTKEDLIEEANLKANLINLETAKLTKQKLVSTQILTAKREEAAELKALEDETKLRKEEEQKIADEKDVERKKQLQEAEDLRILKVKENATEEVRIAKAAADAKKAILAAQLNTVGAGFALLGQMAGKNKTLQAAALVGEAAVSIAKMVAANNLANVGALATPQAILTGGVSAIPVIALNNISTGIGIASTIAATAKGLGSLGGGGSTPTASRGGTSPTPSAQSAPPAFNVVGQSSTNQLASAIGGQSQQPVKAFVVSSDVTTSQEMDRNIVSGASI